MLLDHGCLRRASGNLHDRGQFPAQSLPLLLFRAMADHIPSQAIPCTSRRQTAFSGRTYPYLLQTVAVAANQRTSTSPDTTTAVAELRDLLNTPGSEAMTTDIYKLLSLKQQSNVTRFSNLGVLFTESRKSFSYTIT